MAEGYSGPNVFNLVEDKLESINEEIQSINTLLDTAEEELKENERLRRPLMHLLVSSDDEATIETLNAQIESFNAQRRPISMRVHQLHTRLQQLYRERTKIESEKGRLYRQSDLHYESPQYKSSLLASRKRENLLTEEAQMLGQVVSVKSELRKAMQTGQLPKQGVNKLMLEEIDKELNEAFEQLKLEDSQREKLFDVDQEKRRASSRKQEARKQREEEERPMIELIQRRKQIEARSEYPGKLQELQQIDREIEQFKAQKIEKKQQKAREIELNKNKYIEQTLEIQRKLRKIRALEAIRRQAQTSIVSSSATKDSMYYQNKYLKYKAKYFALKKQIN